MIILDYRDRRPIYEQIVERFQELMVSGVMEEDSQLPSVRSLAMELSINPNTIQRAYAELESEGFIYSVPGKGSFASRKQEADQVRREELLGRLRELIAELRYLNVSDGEILALMKEGVGQ